MLYIEAVAIVIEIMATNTIHSGSPSAVVSGVGDGFCCC
jgi:hypothetical protein